jgi:hypothetical protein
MPIISETDSEKSVAMSEFSHRSGGIRHPYTIRVPEDVVLIHDFEPIVDSDITDLLADDSTGI